MEEEPLDLRSVITMKQAFCRKRFECQHRLTTRQIGIKSQRPVTCRSDLWSRCLFLLSVTLSADSLHSSETAPVKVIHSSL